MHHPCSEWPEAASSEEDCGASAPLHAVTASRSNMEAPAAVCGCGLDNPLLLLLLWLWPGGAAMLTTVATQLLRAEACSALLCLW